MTFEELKNEFNVDASLLDKFLTRMLEVNKQFNLTSITNKEEAIEKHIYDSLLISKHYDFKNKNILDVGSGGGFPGIPLAIMFPNAHFTLLDSTFKKVNYLNETIKMLGLKNVTTICSRVEELNEQEKYDVIISRALAELRVYLELVTSLVKINGDIIALKGNKASDELKSSENAIKELNLSLSKIQSGALPSGDKRINLIFTKKKKTSDKYPRLYSEIIKKPL